MSVIIGIIITFFSILAWLGQVITAISHSTAVKLSLTEPEQDIDPAFFADVRGEAIWDAMTLWVLPVAGILLIINNPWWPDFGLVGGSIYLYFAGRGIFVRLSMQRRAIRIGKPQTIKFAYLFLTIWGLVGLSALFWVLIKLYY